MDLDDPAVLLLFKRAMVARLATLSRGGRPSVNPLYFIYYSGKICLGTPVWTLAARNVQADPRVSLLLNQEREGGPCLRVSGLARLRADARCLHAYNLRVALKYLLPPAALLNRLSHLRQALLVRDYHAQSNAKGPSCVIEVSPQVVEWV